MRNTLKIAHPTWNTIDHWLDMQFVISCQQLDLHLKSLGKSSRVLVFYSFIFMWSCVCEWVFFWVVQWSFRSRGTTAPVYHQTYEDIRCADRTNCTCIRGDSAWSRCVLYIFLMIYDDFISVYLTLLKQCGSPKNASKKRFPRHVIRTTKAWNKNSGVVEGFVGSVRNGDTPPHSVQTYLWC